VLRRWALGALALLLASTAVDATAPPAAHAAPGDPNEIVALVLDGYGNGHGRGMSQWGAYGWATQAGWTWQQILAHYYGNTTLTTASPTDYVGLPTGRMTVRLVALDDAQTAVVSVGGAAQWSGAPNRQFASLVAREVPGAQRVYDVWGSTAPSCPSGSDPLDGSATGPSMTVPSTTLRRGDRNADVAAVQRFLDRFGYEPGPIDSSFGAMTEAAVKRFQTAAAGRGWYSGPVDGVWTAAVASAARQQIAEADAAATWEYLGRSSAVPAGQPGVRFTTPGGDALDTPVSKLLALCQPDGSLVHYRGSIYAANGTDGENRTVNDVPIEAYLQGVVPREVSASWADAAGGAGANAVRAQAVAARSYALAQGLGSAAGRRYSYAKTCDTQACQVYGGAGTRAYVGASLTVREDARTNAAVAATAGLVLKRNGSVVSAEFSASNGPRTAGGVFPAVDDPADAVPPNPNHRWTRVLAAGEVAARYGLGTLSQATTEPDPALIALGIEGDWARRVRLGDGRTSRTIASWDFRGAYGLPSPNFSITAVRRSTVASFDVAFLGDSVGESITTGATPELPTLLQGTFASLVLDARTNRCTVGSCIGGDDGLKAVSRLPSGLDLVVVELGYNDAPGDLGAEIDRVMAALTAKGAKKVAWLTMSERRIATGGTPYFAPSNSAVRAAAGRWPNLVVLDWNAASSGADRNRWYTDNVHLTATGQAELARWLRAQMLALAGGSAVDPPTEPPPPTTQPVKLVAGRALRLPVVGVAGVPSSGVTGVSLNVTVVDPVAAGYLTVYPCGSAAPEASNLNFVAGQTVANAVVAPVDATGEVCVRSSVAAHVLVDLSGWFTSGLSTRVPERVLDTRNGIGPRPR
jgi:lysophospholipase L1-like esterase